MKARSKRIGISKAHMMHVPVSRYKNVLFHFHTKLKCSHSQIPGGKRGATCQKWLLDVYLFERECMASLCLVGQTIRFITKQCSNARNIFLLCLAQSTAFIEGLRYAWSRYSTSHKVCIFYMQFGLKVIIHW